MKSKLNLTVSVLFWALVLMLAYTVMAHAQTGATSSSRAAKQTGSAQTNGTNSAVTGSGTSGQITKWTSASTVSDSVISEDKLGKIGIGTNAPTSKLTVAGTIETTTGVKFPDGSIQTTALESGLTAVTHDATLKGNGTAASPLSVAASDDDPARNAVVFTLTDNVTSYHPPTGKRLVIEFVSGFGSINTGDKYVQISLETTLPPETHSNFFIPTFLAANDGFDIYQISQPTHLYADEVDLTAKRASGTPGNMAITFQGHLVNKQ